MTNHLQEIERAVQAALGTYSNVHRGSGQHSRVSTRLYEQARDIVLEYLGLDRKKYVVIFCTPRRAAILETRLAPPWPRRSIYCGESASTRSRRKNNR